LEKILNRLSKRITVIDMWYDVDLPSKNRFGYDIGNFSSKRLEVIGEQIDGMRSDLKELLSCVGISTEYISTGEMI